MKGNVIILSKQLKPNTKILSGRPEGKQARKEYNLIQVDKSNEVVNVILDEKVKGINPSFFLGLFGDSLQLMGVQKFREKYIFECSDVIRENIEEGIGRAKREYSL